MTLNSAAVVTIAGTLCHDLDDATTIARYYTDVVEMLSLLDSPPFFAGGFIELTASTGVYSLPATVLRLHDAFYGEYYISETKEEVLDAYSKTYRTDEGDPRAFTQDLLNHQIRLYPVPESSSTAGGNALDGDFEADWVYAIGSHNRTSGIHAAHALPIALTMLAKEFSYASKHQDLQFAANCQQLADLIFSMEGVG